MAFTHGKDASFKVTSGGTLRDITTYLTSAGLTQELDEAEVSTLGTTTKQYVAGLKESRIPLEGNFDPTADGWLNTILGGAGTAWEYGPAGTATGAIKYSGSAVLLTYDITTDMGDAAKITGELRVTGAITRGTF